MTHGPITEADIALLLQAPDSSCVVGSAVFTKPSREAHQPILAELPNARKKLVSQSERNQNTRTEPFSLTVDQYGRLWLHSKLEGIEVAIDLAEKEQAFQVMAAVMDEQNFDYLPARSKHDGQADNDDQLRR